MKWLLLFGGESRFLKEKVPPGRFAQFFYSKGEFTQYPFFVRFRPFFYVFASPWKSMRFFICIFISLYPH